MAARTEALIGSTLEVVTMNEVNGLNGMNEVNGIIYAGKNTTAQAAWAREATDALTGEHKLDEVKQEEARKDGSKMEAAEFKAMLGYTDPESYALWCMKRGMVFSAWQIGAIKAASLREQLEALKAARESLQDGQVNIAQYWLAEWKAARTDYRKLEAAAAAAQVQVQGSK